MLKTLQWYIARELFKTFALTAFGLTLVFSLCGGMLNMIQAEVLTAVQVARILMFVLPLATTFTLPVSALFACAIVYGRFAADNEFDACKASGVNIHRLLAPAMGLSIITTAFTFASINFVIPRFIEQLEGIVRSDIQKVATQALSSRGFLKFGEYVLHARQALPFEDAEENLKGLQIKDAAFMMIEQDRLTRCGTADEVYVAFRAGENADMPTVEAVMQGVVALDLVHHQLHQQAVQPFSPRQLPRNLDQKVKYLDLPHLIKLLGNPVEFGKIHENVERTRLLMRDAMFYRYAVNALNGQDKTLRLENARRQYVIRAARAEHGEDDFEPMLRDAVVVETWEDRRREYRADRCSIRVKRNYGDVPDVVHISLSGKVRFVDSLDPDKVNEPKQIDLEDADLPAHIKAQANAVSQAELLGIPDEEWGNLRYEKLPELEPPPMHLGTRLENARYSLLKDMSELGLEISSEVHSRLAFSASSLVMLLLAAGLAIIFRGGQLLTAFVISFAPGLLVVMMNIMGRQMAEKPLLHVPGVALIWIGIGLLIIADVVVLTRYLRR